LGGFINGIMTAVVAWSVCEIRVPETGDVYKSQGLVYSLIIVSLIIVAACGVYFHKKALKD
jgi:hypothetical protein